MKMLRKLGDALFALVGFMGAIMGFVVAVLLVLLMTKEVCSQTACVTNTYTNDGKLVVCQTCCNGNQCNTVCF
jgi:putative flippase GtrA